MKVKVTVEFCPDEPEEEIETNESSLSENQAENSGNNNSQYLETEVSPLDDLRQKFSQKHQ
ncbi:KGK domain-containing protein [Dapis sp. BLCC M172]|uniref:KGK domain-containing protein n=1 Tax=Dapis sp. BLCC M172 TaxID=2975281 RepID=UPI003CF7D34F